MTRRNLYLEIALVGDWIALRSHDGNPVGGRCRVCWVSKDERGRNEKMIVRREDGQPNYEGKVYITISRDAVDPQDGRIYNDTWGGMSNYMLANGGVYV